MDIPEPLLLFLVFADFPSVIDDDVIELKAFSP